MEGQKERARTGYAQRDAYKRSWISYAVRDGKDQLLLVTPALDLGRNMSRVERGRDWARTATFHRTVREVRESAFERNWSVRSVILNEGLEAIGERRGMDGRVHGERLARHD